MATKKRFTEMVKNHTFESIERECKHRYRNAKDDKGSALNSEEFGLLIRRTFASWNIKITKGSQAEHWYKTIKTNFGSRGGVQNSLRTRTEKPKTESKAQIEFKYKESWSQKDRENYGRVLRALRELDTRVPRTEIINRLQMYEVRSIVREAAIKKWRQEIREEASKY